MAEVAQPLEPPIFAWLERDAHLARAFTARPGGVSDDAYAGLNLGSRVNDDPAAVARNRAILATELGLSPESLVFLHQVHGADVVEVHGPTRAEPIADAVVTTATGLGIAALAADCVPVLLSDPSAGVIAAAHVGRPGLVAGTASAAVSAMRDLGARRIEAVLGPAVCSACYEVPQQLHDDVVALIPSAHAVSSTGTPALDIARGVLTQLAELGVGARQVLGCTRESPQHYSYRRDGVTGRHAGVIALLRAPGRP